MRLDRNPIHFRHFLYIRHFNQCLEILWLVRPLPKACAFYAQACKKQAEHTYLCSLVERAQAIMDDLHDEPYLDKARAALKDLVLIRHQVFKVWMQAFRDVCIH